MPTYQVCFRYTGSFDQPLVVGDAVRWEGPDVWRVEAVEGNRVTVGLWPDDVPYPELVRTFGPGEWPGQKKTV